MLVTGTLGLAYPASRAALIKAVDEARASGCKVCKSVGRHEDILTSLSNICISQHS